MRLYFTFLMPFSVSAFTMRSPSGHRMNHLQKSQASSTVALAVKPILDPMGLYGKNSPERLNGKIVNETVLTQSSNKVIYDPLNLYPSDSLEKKNGMIRALEPELVVQKAVIDPMKIYSKTDTSVQNDVSMSKSLPFLTRPILLDGEIPGDVGFDPLGFVKTRDDLIIYREAEIKHARLAMLAAAGWPLSELFDKKIASMLHMTPLVDASNRVPSLLNGGIGKVNPFYWMLCLVIASAIEFVGINKSKSRDTNYFPGSLGFDPLNMYPKDKQAQERMQLAEIKNGRLAMVAIVGFALQEFVSKSSVVNETPLFFLPLKL